MGEDITDFWQRFQSGVVEITVASRGHVPEKSLGIREAFLRYFHEILDRDQTLVVRVELLQETPDTPMTDRDTLEAATQLVEQARQLNPDSLFVVACEEGLSEAKGLGGEVRHLVKSWAVVDACLPETSQGDPRYQRSWGSSAGIQIPQHLLDGDPGTALLQAFPSTRRSGGMVQNLTQGLESRRSHAGQATFLALCSLLYGRVVG